LILPTIMPLKAEKTNAINAQGKELTEEKLNKP
jgi:hypothetical protein